MSLREELLIPFRGSREVGRALVAGSLVICRCAGRLARRGLTAAWAHATAGTTAGDRLESLGVAALSVVMGGAVVVVVSGAVLHLVAPYAQVIGWVAMGGWVIAAWAVAPPVNPEKRKIIKGGGAAAPPAPAGQETVPLDGWTVVRTVREIAAPHGWKGAHLDDILARLPGRSREELLAVLADARIPVADQLKLTLPGGRQINRQGVRVDALPPGLEEAPVWPTSTPPAGPADGLPEAAPRSPHLTVHGQQ
ncbi:hypothetical protein ACWERV_16985 [Streptomyces sp. NPDC004031]